MANSTQSNKSETTSIDDVDSNDKTEKDVKKTTNKSRLLPQNVSSTPQSNSLPNSPVHEDKGEKKKITGKKEWRCIP